MRVRGPFDGLRLGLIDHPVSIYDLSDGGCFVLSLDDNAAGGQFVLKIDLGADDWISATVSSVYNRPPYGFAVQFLELSDADRARLEQRLQRLRQSAP